MDYVRVRVEAARLLLMYHGTTSKFLRTILKKGLVPGKMKVWDAEKKDLESLEGVYLTNSFMTAYSAAGTAFRKFGGNRLFVIAQVSLGVGIAMDEDELLPIIAGALHSVIHCHCILLETLKDEKVLKKALDEGFKDFVKRLQHYVEKKHRKRVAATLKKKEGKIRKCLYYFLLDSAVKEIGHYLKGVKYYEAERYCAPPEILWDYAKTTPRLNRRDTQKKLRKYLDEVSKIVGLLTKGFKKEVIGPFLGLSNVRVPSIGYKGRTKIVGIVEETRAEMGNNELTIHYERGKIANRLKKDYEKAIGKCTIIRPS